MMYMDIAHVVSKLSRCNRAKVGAIIVKDRNIVAYGYNGTPAGWTNVCEENIYDDNGDVIRNQTKDEVIHAEANAISKLARDGERGNGADLFCTHAPCIHCAKLIYGAGIKKVYYRNTYRDELGLDFLKKCDIDVEKV